MLLLHMQIRRYFNEICDNIRSLHDIFHIGPGISPRLPYQSRQRRWRADMGRGLKFYFRNLSVQRSFMQYKSQCLEKVNVKYVIKRL
jgi:hypothetical protein